MTHTLAELVLVCAGAGVFTAAMIGDTIPEILGAFLGAFLGMFVAVGGPTRLTSGSVLNAAVAGLWASMLVWLAVIWWECLTGRVLREDARR